MKTILLLDCLQPKTTMPTSGRCRRYKECLGVQLVRSMVVLIGSYCAVDVSAQIFHGLSHLPGGTGESVSFGISADGSRVVGYSVTDMGPEAFLWTEADGMIGLGTLGGMSHGSLAFGISDDGNVIVGQSESPMGLEAFRWTQQSGMSGLGDLTGGSFNSLARSASFDGSVIVGYGTTVRNEPGQPDLQVAFRWTEGTGMSQLGVIPHSVLQSEGRHVSADGSVIVGDSLLGAFLHTGSSMTFIGGFPGGSPLATAQGVSADGSVIVGQGVSENGSEAFRWTAETGIVGLGELPGGNFDSIAFAISSDGQVIVGRDHRPTDYDRAFVWRQEFGMYNLRFLLAAAGAEIAGWQLHEAYAVSADGSLIAGSGQNPIGRREAWIASVPPLPPEDVNGDQSMDCADIDALVSAIASGTNPPDFDFNGDGLVNGGDLDHWLIVAGRVNNFVTAAPFRYGDANLDGVVDGQDFVIWNANKFTSTPSWCSGDFNGDGLVDGSDFIRWNENKFQSSATAVPEPSGGLIYILVLSALSSVGPNVRVCLRQERTGNGVKSSHA